MVCKNCVVTALSYTIKFEGSQNIALLPLVSTHLARRGFKAGIRDRKIKIGEAGAKEFLDFSEDILDMHELTFCVDDGPWRPLSEMREILATSWIDELLQASAVVSYSQPIVNRERQIIAYEILSRFVREDGSLIYPNEVFDAARTRGRLYALDRMCRMAAVRHAKVVDKKVFINFIPTSIYSPAHCLQSTEQLANTLGVDPDCFVFEVVESDDVADIAHLREILAYYKTKGFQYALDDVGEGFNTIERLTDLQPDYMKLDIGYVRGVHADAEKQRVAQLFLQKAQEVGATPLAEGVEDEADFAWLREAGYELFQGYLFGKPSAIPQRELPPLEVKRAYKKTLEA